MYKTAITMFASLLTAFSVGGCAGDKGDSYRVEDGGGVPRLMFNGEPVRPRMLYVSPTYFMLGSPTRRNAAPYAYTAWTDTFIEIPAMKSAVPNGEIHMNLGKTPFEYKIAGLEIAEYPSGKKVYEIDFKNRDKRVKIYRGNRDKSELSFEQADGAGNVLRVANSAKEEFILAFGDVKLEAGKVYHINVKIKSKRGNDFETYLAADGKLVEPKVRSFVGVQTAIAKDAGVDIITFPVQAADLMPKDGKSYDFNKLKGALDEIVAANPNAKILLRIRFYPPQWWLDKYSDDVMTRENGGKCEFPCVSSQRYREDSAKVLKMFIDYCEKNYGKNIIGYHPGGGNSCEWFYGDSWRPLWSGYDKSTLEAWRKWLLKKYKTDAALQAAWGNPNAVLADASVPTKAERDATDILINPQTQRKIVDFNTFQQDEMVDMIASLAKVIRQEVPDKLCVFFYGYAGEFSGMHNGPSQSGHYALGKLLKNKDIDALCGPISYYDRNIGDGKTTMGATESIMRNGMLWIDEDDTSTYLAPKNLAVPGFEKGQDTREKTLDVLTRNMSHEAVRNIGSWWMDLTGGGWFKDAELWKLKTLFKNIEEDFIKNPSPYNPPVALILDEPSVWHVGGKGASALSTRVFGTARKQLNRSAVPFGHYVLDDFLFGKPVKSKLDVYAVAYALDAKKRKAIRKRAKNKAAIYGWATGYIDTDKNRFSPEAMEETTGFKMEENAKPTNGIAIPTSAGKSIGLSENFGIDRELRPALYPVLEDGDIVFATYPNGKPAVVLRGKRLYCGVSHIPAEIYRHMAKLAGIHIYADTPAAVYANGAYIHITPADIPEGETRIVNVDTNSDKPVFDALSGEKLSDGSKISFKMKKGQSKILRLGDGNTDFAK